MPACIRLNAGACAGQDTTSELGDEETPAAEKGVKGPFARQLF
jgi:hypothetical protein